MVAASVKILFVIKRENLYSPPEQNKIILFFRYDQMMPKIAETKNIVDALWKSYQVKIEILSFVFCVELI